MSSLRSGERRGEGEGERKSFVLKVNRVRDDTISTEEAIFAGARTELSPDIIQ